MILQTKINENMVKKVLYLDFNLSQGSRRNDQVLETSENELIMFENIRTQVIDAQTRS